MVYAAKRRGSAKRNTTDTRAARRDTASLMRFRPVSGLTRSRTRSPSHAREGAQWLDALEDAVRDRVQRAYRCGGSAGFSPASRTPEAMSFKLMPNVKQCHATGNSLV
jgi:hypothetical protein